MKANGISSFSCNKNQSKLRPHSRSWGRDLNQRPPECVGMLRTRWRHSVVFIIYRHLILVQHAFTHACCQRRNERTGRELVHFFVQCFIKKLYTLWMTWVQDL